MTHLKLTNKQLIKDLHRHAKNVAVAVDKFEKEPTFDNLMLAKVVAKNCSSAFDRAVTAEGVHIAKAVQEQKEAKRKKKKQQGPRGLGL